jgi:hypothetical protein
MTDSRINLRTPWFAALLAFLVPGLGHAYQRRYFKAVIYFFCITGMFVMGARMADWKAVQAPPFNYRANNRGLLWLKFAAQFGMGLPSMAAIVQANRFQKPENDAPTRLDQTITAPFDGTYFSSQLGSPDGEHVTGTLTLEPAQGVGGDTIAGHFTGVNDTGGKVDLKLDRHIALGRPIDSDAGRTVSSGIESDGRMRSERISGAIPRPIQNWLFVPLGEKEQQTLEGHLGKWLELALVLTWIAGLLNMLAIWDAFEGPAWGYDAESDGSGPTIIVTQTPARAAVPESAVTG